TTFVGVYLRAGVSLWSVHVCCCVSGLQWTVGGSWFSPALWSFRDGKQVSGWAVVPFPAQPSHQPLHVAQHQNSPLGQQRLCGLRGWRFADIAPLSRQPLPILFLSVFCPRRASEWQLDQPSWSGRLRITAKGKVAYIKLEDRTSGELFAQAPVDQFPGTAVESVTDSSRYFVIRIEDGNGRRAFIGLGFGDRGDAFDFNVALQDHFKWVKQQCEFAKQAQNPDEGPKLDLGFKDGQTIKINIALASWPLREMQVPPVDWWHWDSFSCLEETNI
uniref:NECAP PHear domain-containing protein n=1 Tax=Mus spicilegus TaxID=10103 RepID=A0A8C6H5Z6_MUSSI